MSSWDFISIKRDCDAIEIPSGNDIKLPKGTEVVLLQRLGGNFTVMAAAGLKATIAGQDADAINQKRPEETKIVEQQGKSVEDLVREQLKTCYDPEIAYNIVDLGLLYETRLIPRADALHKVFIKLTLTAPGCGMGDWMKKDIQKKLLRIPGVAEVEVELVFDPPWTPEKMAPALRRELI